MNLKDFLTLKVGSGLLLSGNTYKPYINYTWSNTFQVANKMYSKNIGNSGYDLQLFSGQGFKSNGTNQTITIPVNATVLTEIKRVNGSVVLNTNQQVITDYVIGTGAAAVHTDYFLFTAALTADEIALYSANPNQFFQNVQDGVIDNCVLNMPLHGVDKYQVDYSRYSLGLVNADVTLSNSPPTGANTITKNGNVFTITNTVAELYNYQPYIRFYPLIYDTSLYTVKIKVKCISGTAYIKQFEGTPQIILNKVLTVGQEYTYESATRFSNIGGQKGSLIFDGVNYTNFTVEVTVEVYKVVAGINEVINYTADCVTLAKQLPYGSQEANFFHTSSGVPIRTGLSPFFESTPYWNNYGNTGWVPKWNEDFTVETVLEMSNDLAFRLNGNNYGIGVFFGEQTVGNNLYVRVFGSPTAYIINTKNIVCLTFSYNWQSKEVKCYADGVLAVTELATQTTNSTLPVLLGLVALTGDNYPLIKPIRLFKVHSKVLTQEDITKNFNEYTAKGLLDKR